MTYRYSKAGCHSIKVVRMLAHGHDFRNDSLISPLNTKYFGQLLKILSRGLADREDGITEPAHAKTAQFFVKELNAKL